MKNTCWAVVLTSVAIPMLSAPCRAAALKESGYVTKISGDVVLESVDRRGQDTKDKLDAKRDNGVVVYANEVLRCGKGGSCELHMFAIQGPGGEPSKKVTIAGDTAVIESRGERETLELDGDGYRVGGLSGAGGGGESFPPPVKSRKKINPRR